MTLTAMLVLYTSKLVEIFEVCDDFIKNLEQAPSDVGDFGYLPSQSKMSKSEIMYILAWA
jgi:hypothetical protein